MQNHWHPSSNNAPYYYQAQQTTYSVTTIGVVPQHHGQWAPTIGLHETHKFHNQGLINSPHPFSHGVMMPFSPLNGPPSALSFYPHIQCHESNYLSHAVPNGNDNGNHYMPVSVPIRAQHSIRKKFKGAACQAKPQQALTWKHDDEVLQITFRMEFTAGQLSKYFNISLPLKKNKNRMTVRLRLLKVVLQKRLPSLNVTHRNIRMERTTTWDIVQRTRFVMFPS